MTWTAAKVAWGGSAEAWAAAPGGATAHVVAPWRARSGAHQPVRVELQDAVQRQLGAAGHVSQCCRHTARDRFARWRIATGAWRREGPGGRVKPVGVQL